MTTFTLIGATRGAPDNSQATLAHFYQQTLASGARMAWGNGDGTGLVVWENAIGVENSGGFVSRINTNATAARTLTIPDATGTVVLGDGSGVTDSGSFKSALGIQSAILSSDFATTVDTAQAVTGFTVPLAVSKTYQLKAVLRVKTAASGTGLRPRITGPGGTVTTATFTARTISHSLSIDGLDVDADFAGLNATDTPEIMIIEGMLVTNSTSPASELGLSVHSENSGTAVTVLAGSSMILTAL